MRKDGTAIFSIKEYCVDVLHKLFCLNKKVRFIAENDQELHFMYLFNLYHILIYL